MNDAYLDATMTKREEIVGRNIFDLRRLFEIFDQFLAVERERVPVSAE